MRTATTEARRLWTTTPRKQWAEELEQYPEKTSGICSREGVRQALRLALAAVAMGGSYQGMSADNRFSAESGGSEQGSGEE